MHLNVAYLYVCAFACVYVYICLSVCVCVRVCLCMCVICTNVKLASKE
jgi:hypothetical protein